MKTAAKFLIGFVAGILSVFVVALLVGRLGWVDVAATTPEGRLDAWLGSVADHSIEHRAKDEKNPVAGDPKAIAAGMGHFKENCLDCHGAPGVEATEFAKGLNPAAPDLADPDSQELTDGQIYWIVSNGIRMTGMPAFSPTHSPEEVWHIVAFVRHLPQLTDEEKKSLGEGREDEAEHHQEGEPGKP